VTFLTIQTFQNKDNKNYDNKRTMRLPAAASSLKIVTALQLTNNF
jgi:hypothetical protein